LTRPKAGELFTDLEDAFIHIHNWGFTQGILLIKKSTNNKRGRWQIDYSRYYKETANWRKTPLKERQRLGTHFLANDCKFSLYISQQKRQND
jgi:hypothetical protein